MKLQLVGQLSASLSFACRGSALHSTVRGPPVVPPGLQHHIFQQLQQASSTSCSSTCAEEAAYKISRPGRQRQAPLGSTLNLQQRWHADASDSGAYVEAAASASQAANPAPEYSGIPKLLVFGGNGFVGSHVCEEALKTGLAVVSVNRSGPPKLSAPWINEVEWVRADVFDVLAWRSQLLGAIGVISTLGAFGSNDFMYKICGEANVKVFDEAAAAGVPRASFISVHDFGLPDVVLSGYFKGKRRAEEALRESFPSGGVAIRPGIIYGTRYVSGVGIPLGAFGVPLEKVLSFLPAKSLASIPLLGAGFVPPISVQAVARAAVTAATDPAVPAGVMDIWQLQSYDNKV